MFRISLQIFRSGKVLKMFFYIILQIYIYNDIILFMGSFTRRLIVLPILICFFSIGAYAQRVALKTNILHWATMSPNLSAEFVCNRNITFDFGVTANPFQLKNIDTRAFAVYPEVRYWFGRPMSEHFLGINAMFSQYDLRYKKDNVLGDAFTAGISYGYVFILGKHWNLETNIGVGWMRYRCKTWKEGETIPMEPNKIKDIIAPVRLGVTLSYIIK